MVKLSILGIPVNLVTLSEAVELSIEAIKKQKRFRIMTANAEMIMQAQDHSELRSALQNSELVVADGAGVVWASKEFGIPLKERVAGVDLAYLLLEKAAAEKIKVFLFRCITTHRRNCRFQYENQVSRTSDRWGSRWLFSRIGR
jgi:N-acetylglucosaminyldiphosphoundecaprenol N-acetyl-beta-D-mannosaminyltransferase